MTLVEKEMREFLAYDITFHTGMKCFHAYKASSKDCPQESTTTPSHFQVATQ